LITRCYVVVTRCHVAGWFTLICCCCPVVYALRLRYVYGCRLFVYLRFTLRCYVTHGLRLRCRFTRCPFTFTLLRLLHVYVAFAVTFVALPV